MADVYLREHPNPNKSQYHSPRRQKVSGVFVVHTAENTPDFVAFDGGAEAVARYIAIRDTYGSYHFLADSDSVLRLVRWTDEAYHDATSGGNRHEIGGSIATRADAWELAPKKWRDGAIDNLAIGFAEAARYVKTTTGIVVPARRITRAESEDRKPGFISHALRDPKRRSDPGWDEEPDGYLWDLFLERYRRHAADVLGIEPPAPKPEPELVPGGTDMAAAWRLPDGTVWACSGAGHRQHLRSADEVNLRALAGLITPVPKDDPNADRIYPKWVRVAPGPLVAVIKALTVVEHPKPAK